MDHVQTDVRFGGWTLRRAAGELESPDSATVRLPGQALAVLEALLERPGEVVTREVLRQRLWPRGVVEFDTALNSVVRRLRRALDDEAGAPRCIETLPRRGYRLIVAVEPALPRAAAITAAAARAEVIAGAVSAEAAARGPAGPAEQGKPIQARQPVPLARHWPAWLLGAGLAALGTFVMVRLPAVGTVVLQPAAGTAADPVDPVALDHVQRGRYFFQRRGTGDLLRAQQQFDLAIVRRPDLADAHAGLAGVYFIRLTEGSIDRHAGLRGLGEAVRRALALDPAHPEALMRARNFAYATGQVPPPQTTTPAQHAPDSTLGLVQRGIELLRAGRATDAVGFLRRAVRAEPLNTVARTGLAYALFVAGHLQEAEQTSLGAAELAGNGVPALVAGRVMLLQGRLQEAGALASTWPDGPDRRQFMALLRTAAGDEVAARTALQVLMATDGPHDPLLVAEVFAYRSELEQALGWLQPFERVRADPALRVRMSVAPWMIAASPLATPLHSDPRFVRWLQSNS